MANHSRDLNMSYVDTGSMRDAAATMRKELGEISAMQEELQGSFQMMCASWRGPAADIVFEGILQTFRGLQEAQASYAGLLADLEGYAQAREQAHANATAIASRVEVASWAEV